MLIKEKSPSLAKKGNKNNSDKISIPKHYAVVHPTAYLIQPTKREMGKVINYFKYRGIPKKHGINELLSALSSGHCVIPSNIEIDDENNIQFISSTLMLIDIDDIEKETDPAAVLKKLSDMVTGLFYTFSHGKEGKGNRYRLVFQLDRAIRDRESYEMMIEVIGKTLIERGLPSKAVDTIKNSTRPVRPGIQGCLINNFGVTLKVDYWMQKIEQLQQARIAEAKERADNAFDALENSMKFKVTFDELKEMAEAVGYIPSGVGLKDEWSRIVMGIKHHANSGAISQDEGFQLFDIISGGEESEKSWNSMRPSGRATIGTLIYHAKQKGYKWKQYRYALNDAAPDVKIERHKVKDYIPVDLATELLERKQKILVDSPTGSGKTRSFIDAFKGLENSSNFHYYVFSAPTRALTEQIAATYGVMAVKGQDPQLFNRLKQYTREGHRIFIATYDMTPALTEFLTSYNRAACFSLVVDEIHKYVTDYEFSYRYKAINELHKASQKAVSFIGLSGTPNDILKDEFDSIVQIDNGNPSSPCSDFAVYTYEQRKEALPMLVKLIETWVPQRRLLIFIQSKEKIQQLYDLLRKRGIKARTVTANEKSNSTYKSLVEQSKIDDNVQVVIATSVIADGINIENTLEWECMAVCNDFSDLFNVSTLKQISNRFRNKYRRFSVFMQEPKIKDEDIFNIDGCYQYLNKIASTFTEMMNGEYEKQNLSLFRASVLERKYGIYSDGEKIAVNTLHLRHTASREQERYYKGRRNAFIRSLERILHKKLIGVLNISEAVRKKNLDITALERQIAEMEAADQAAKDAKMQSIASAFTYEVYEAFQNDDEQALNEFKKQVSPAHYSCLNRLHKIATYEICKVIVQQVKRDADTHAFYNGIKAMIDIGHFCSINRGTPTRKVFLELKKVTDFIASADLKELIEKKLPKRLKVSKTDIKEVLKMFVQTHERNMKERFTKLSPITPEVLANQYGLTVNQVKECMKNYLKMQPKSVQVAAKNYYKL